MNQSKELQQIIALVPANFADPDADCHAVRTTFAPYHGHATADDLDMAILRYGGIRCGKYTVEGCDKGLTAFHCHGGAFVSTPLDEYHFYGEIIARHTGCQVITPDYRLAPEAPYPAAGNDCFDAYCGLLEQGTNPTSIALMGESCGGSLALGLLVRLRDEGVPLPACFVSLTGWFDLSVADNSERGQDPFLTAEWVRNRGHDYLQGQLQLNDPRVSPAYANLTNLPPMYLQIGQFDTMREGAMKLGNNAIRAGVQVTMESWPAMVHGWHGLVSAGVPEARSAWRAIKAYIERICCVT